MTGLGRALRVAVVGAGPAGLYAAGHLLEAPGGTYLDGRLQRLVHHPVEVDVLDQLSTPWGLVRHGVAPDHPEKKLVQRVFEETASRNGFRFFGNISLGRDVTAAELTEWCDAVVYAVGAAGDTRLGIPGEDLEGSLSARALVAWYNGHPEAADLDPDLSGERAVVIGNGNVALDVARILSLPVEVLARTDIAAHALDALANSRIREVVVIGRRTQLHAAFNNPELEELGRLPGVDVAVERDELSHGLLDTLDATTRRKVETLRRYADHAGNGNARRIVLRFLAAPARILGTDRVTGIQLATNHAVREGDTVRVRPDGRQQNLAAGLVLRSIGYFGTPVPGLPFDEAQGVVPNDEGRVLDAGTPLPGVYVTGWAKRGPRGIIGTNKVCARDTVRSLLADLDRLPTATTLTAADVETVLRSRRPALVDQYDWLRRDAAERRAGRAAGRPRVKILD